MKKIVKNLGFNFIILGIYVIFSKAQYYNNKDVEFYIIKARDTSIGYIESLPIKKVKLNNQSFWLKSTKTFLKTKMGRKYFDYRVLENTYYSIKDMKIRIYNLIYQQGREGGERKYFFKNNRLKIIYSKNNKKTYKSYYIPKNTYLFSDYFSLIYLLKKAKYNPILVNVLDLKKMSKYYKPKLQKLFIRNLGEEIIKIDYKEYRTYKYVINWEGNRLYIWINFKTKPTIYKIEDKRRDTTIYLCSEREVKSFAYSYQRRIFKRIRRLPFDINHLYVYNFYYMRHRVGRIMFEISRTDEGNYKIKAVGSLYTRNFESETIYNPDFLPLYYYIKEPKIEITCRFILRGVKETIKQGKNTLNRFFPLSPDFVFLDNNAIHHFIVFLAQCPLKVGKKFSFSIFHPRRIDCTEAYLKVIKKEGSIYTLKLNTPFYEIKLWVDSGGKLIKYYQQGGLIIMLGN